MYEPSDNGSLRVLIDRYGREAESGLGTLARLMDDQRGVVASMEAMGESLRKLAFAIDGFNKTVLDHTDRLQAKPPRKTKKALRKLWEYDWPLTEREHRRVRRYLQWVEGPRGYQSPG